MLLGIGLILVGIFSAFGASAMYTVNLSSIIWPIAAVAAGVIALAAGNVFVEDGEG